MMHSLLLLGKFQNAHEPVSINTCSVLMQPQVEAAATRSASHIRPVANVPIPYHSLISKLPPHAEHAESNFMNTNRANLSKGNVGSRLGATEWTGSLARFFLASCEDAKSAKQDSPSAPHICPNSASSEAGQIMPQIPHRPSENARKSLAGSGERSSKMTANRVGADTPIETRCSHKGLPSDTVFFR